MLVGAAVLVVGLLLITRSATPSSVTPPGGEFAHPCNDPASTTGSRSDPAPLGQRFTVRVDLDGQDGECDGDALSFVFELSGVDERLDPDQGSEEVPVTRVAVALSLDNPALAQQYFFDESGARRGGCCPGSNASGFEGPRVERDLRGPFGSYTREGYECDVPAGSDPEARDELYDERERVLLDGGEVRFELCVHPGWVSSSRATNVESWAWSENLRIHWDFNVVVPWPSGEWLNDEDWWRNKSREAELYYQGS
jgi:hypothetical protein